LFAQRNRYEGSIFIPNYRSFASGFFWIERWQGNRWELEAGLRYDYRWMRVVRWSDNVIVKPEYSFHNASVTLGANCRVTPLWQWNFHLGTAWRPPHVSELFSAGLHHGTASFEIGNPTLTTEKALKAISSISYKDKSKKLNLELDSYAQYIWDYIYLKPVFPPTLTVRGAFPTFAYSQVNAFFGGTDIKLTYALWAGLAYEGKFSMVRAIQLDSKEHLLLIPPDRYEHTLRWSANPKKITVALSVVQRQKQWRVSPHQDYAPPPNGVVLINFFAEQTFLLTSRQTIWIGIGVENVLNTAYRDYMNRFRYFADEAGRNFSLRIKYSF
ncbi:MAG: TonB-dependent receptor, partial [Flammeovirgaceae bacterium]|nr:TonB-dependent receptor [Flammeovirgaceae bacterium]